MNFTATEISLEANETNFWTFLTLFLSPIGFIGLIFNLLIILTVRKQDKEKSPSGLAVQLLAIWNSVAILGDTFLEIVLSIFEASISDLVCKAIQSFHWLGGVTVNWHVVIICLGRYLSVAVPAWYHQKMARKHVWVVSICVTGCLWVSQWPTIYFFRKVNDQCTMVAGNLRAFDVYLPDNSPIWCFVRASRTRHCDFIYRFPAQTSHITRSKYVVIKL